MINRWAALRLAPTYRGYDNLYGFGYIWSRLRRIARVYNSKSDEKSRGYGMKKRFIRR